MTTPPVLGIRWRADRRGVLWGGRQPSSGAVASGPRGAVRGAGTAGPAGAGEADGRRERGG
ncbi:MAG: hypothetical protein ACRDQY_25890, partial [Pseudonocardiaceae bacterium]